MDTYLTVLRSAATSPPGSYRFGHDVLYRDLKPALLCSYHPSQQNTSTGKLTQTMLDDLFLHAQRDYPIRTSSLCTSPVVAALPSRSTIDVHFGSNAEIRQINPGFHGEERARQDAAVVVCFQIVHVRAGSVHFFADGMARAVDELVAVALATDVLARGVVHFEPAQVSAGCDCS